MKRQQAHGRYNKTKRIRKPQKKKGKTVPCKYFQMGNCARGSACQFSHAIAQGLETLLCKYHLVGNCKKGDKCLLSHDFSKFPCKYFFISGNCQKMGHCQFSHERFKDRQILETFISENLEGVYQHFRNGVETAFNLFVVENGYLDEKLQRNRQLSGDIRKMEEVMQQASGKSGVLPDADMIESARKKNQGSFNILNALIGDCQESTPGTEQPQKEEEGPRPNLPKSEQGTITRPSQVTKKKADSDSEHKSCSESEEAISECFDPF